MCSSHFKPSSLSVQPFGEAAIQPSSSSESFTHPKEGRFPFIMIKGGRWVPSTQMQSTQVINSRLPSVWQVDIRFRAQIKQYHTLGNRSTARIWPPLSVKLGTAENNYILTPWHAKQETFLVDVVKVAWLDVVLNKCMPELNVYQ